MLQTERPASCHNKCCKTSLISNNNNNNNNNLELKRRTKSGPVLVSRQKEETKLSPDQPTVIPKWLYKVPDETYVEPSIKNVELKRESQERRSTDSRKTNRSNKTPENRPPSITPSTKSSKCEIRVDSTKPPRAPTPTPTPVKALDKRVRSLEKILENLKFFRRNPTRQQVYYNYVKRYETKKDNIAEILHHNCYTPPPATTNTPPLPHSNNNPSSHKFYTNTWRLFIDCKEIGSNNNNNSRGGNRSRSSSRRRMNKNNEIIGTNDYGSSIINNHNKQINLTPASTTIVAYRHEIK